MKPKTNISSEVTFSILVSVLLFIAIWFLSRNILAYFFIGSSDKTDFVNIVSVIFAAIVAVILLAFRLRSIKKN